MIVIVAIFVSATGSDVNDGDVNDGDGDGDVNHDGGDTRRRIMCAMGEIKIKAFPGSIIPTSKHVNPTQCIHQIILQKNIYDLFSIWE